MARAHDPEPSNLLRDDGDDRWSDEHKLANDMIDVHGREAATVARENARAAALAGQAARAKAWIRVLGIIQQAGKLSGEPSRGNLVL